MSINKRLKKIAQILGAAPRGSKIFKAAEKELDKLLEEQGVTGNEAEDMEYLDEDDTEQSPE